MSGETGMQKSHCCCCVTGVLFSILGIGLLCTGISMILDYGAFDVTTLPSGWQNSEGQRNLGIIITCLSCAMLIIGVLVGVVFFTGCGKRRGEQTDIKSPETSRPKPKPPDVVVTISQSNEPGELKPQSRSKHRRSRRKHAGKKTKKNAALRLETHHEETVEEQDSMYLREIRSAGRRRTVSTSQQHHIPAVRTSEKGSEDLYLGINKDLSLPPLVPHPAHLNNSDHIGNLQLLSQPPVVSQSELLTSPEQLPHLLPHGPLSPPLQVAPATKEMSTCSVDDVDSEEPMEPEVFRASRLSMSSGESSSIIASTSTGDIYQPVPNYYDLSLREQLNRELSDILK